LAIVATLCNLLLFFRHLGILVNGFALEVNLFEVLLDVSTLRIGSLDTSHQLSALCGATHSHVPGFDLVEEVLLGSEDGAGTSYPNPTDKSGGRETEVLHSI
jgi:hypothetical protein